MRHIRRLIFILVFTVIAGAGAFSLADSETILFPSEETGYLSDGNLLSCIRIKPKTAVTITVPDGARYLYLQYKEPLQEDMEISYRSVSGEINGWKKDTAFKGDLRTLVYIPGQTSSVEFKTSKQECLLAEVSFPTPKERAELPYFKRDGTVDLMLIVAHTGDETSYFSGLLQKAAEEGYSTMTVFMSGYDREAQEQAIRNAWSLGQPVEPVFMGKKYIHVDEHASANTPDRVWGSTINVTNLAEVIMTYRPSVIVTHASEPENRDQMHFYTSELVQKAVQKVNRKAEETGEDAYRVEKLYLKSLTEDGGTVTQVYDTDHRATAQKATDAYSSIRLFRLRSDETVRYKLAVTTVGEDTRNNDLFENIKERSEENHRKPGSIGEIASLNTAGLGLSDAKYDSFFLERGDENEIVTSDNDAGIWEYRSSSLSVKITRNHSMSGKRPVVSYVAHIRMRDVNSFRPGFGDAKEKGGVGGRVSRITKRAKTVLAINGDNLRYSEIAWKGRMVRNNIVYGNGRAQPTLILGDDMSLSVMESIEMTAQQMADAGVRNSFGFGPVLVRDGAVSEKECKRHRTFDKNPRAGIGMVEPGHLVAIFVEGRQRRYSVGLNLLDFAQLFVDEGCTIAYNMDGGATSGMSFMGTNLLGSDPDSYAETRGWTDALMFGYSELIPSEDG